MEVNMKQQHKFSLSYYLFVFMTIVLLESLFFTGSAVKEISYSRFRNLLQADRIKSVIVQPDHIFGLLKTSAKVVSSKDAAKDTAKKAAKDTAKDTVRDTTGAGESPGFQPQSKQAPWHLDFSLFQGRHQKNAGKQFMVTRVDDPKLIADLQAHGVDYRGRIESHWFSHFLANWILPLGFFILLGSFLARRMGKGAGFLDVGKNKARIYAVDPSQKVTFDDVAGVDEAVEEVKEVVSFLKEPDRYTRLGAKLPKGILLISRS